MPQPIKERLDKTRDNLRTLRKDLNRTAEPLKERAEELRQQVIVGRDRLQKAEADLLESAADTLGRARHAINESSPMLKRGEKALREALVDLRVTHPATLPVANYDKKNVEQAQHAVEHLDLAGLRTIRAYEVRTKNRVTVVRAIDQRITTLIEH